PATALADTHGWPGREDGGRHGRKQVGVKVLCRSGNEAGHLAIVRESHEGPFEASRSLGVPTFLTIREQAMRGTKNWVGIGLGMVVVSLMVLLLTTSAVAGIVGLMVLTWPGSAAVGDLFVATGFVSNESTFPNDRENVSLLQISVTPACATDVSPVCGVGS